MGSVPKVMEFFEQYFPIFEIIRNKFCLRYFKNYNIQDIQYQFIIVSLLGQIF